MDWNIIVFESTRGEQPVEHFIKSQQKQTQSKISHAVDLLESYGLLLAMPHIKKLTSRIYELRTRGQEEVRILFGVKGKDIYLVHAFKKKTEKTPLKEIEIAERRFKTIEEV